MALRWVSREDQHTPFFSFRFGHQLTLCILKIHLLTYLQTSGQCLAVGRITYIVLVQM